MHQNATDRISIAHAYAVAHAAVNGGQATWSGADPDKLFTPSADLTAFLADLGIETLAGMNERQANAVLAFVEQRATDRPASL